MPSCSRTLVWDLAQELVEYPELVHQLGGRRMDGVPAEVAEEVTVLFHDEGRHTRPREQIAEHHPGRSATGHEAGGRPYFHRNS